MKQKYTISKNDQENKLIIREYAELDKEMMSFLCEEIYNDSDIESALAQGKMTLIDTLRTKNIFPVGIYAEKIAEEVMKIYESEDNSSAELFFNDIDMLSKEENMTDVIEDVEDDADGVDDLLDEDDTSIVETEDLTKVSFPLKVADDDANDVADSDPEQ